MLTRSTFAVVVASLLTVLAVVGVVLGPYPAWWNLYAPSLGAAFSLREATYLVRSDGCASDALQAWQRLYHDPEGRLWFRAVARDALHPAGRTYALAGLYALDYSAFDSVVRATKPHLLIEPMQVLDSAAVRWLSIQELMPDLAGGRLAAIYADPALRPWC